MAAGYSGTPLLKKLGILPNASVKLINAPSDYFTLLEADISDQICPNETIPNLVHLFVTLKNSLSQK